jgi:hypothetical protein
MQSATMRPLHRLLGLALLVLPLVRRAHGMIDTDQHIDCGSDDGFFPTWSFEFAAGGTLAMNMTLLPGGWSTNNHTIQVLLCSESQMDPIRSASMDDVCKADRFNFSPTLWQTTLGSDEATSVAFDNLTIPVSDWVRLLVLNCDGDEFHLVFDDVAMNPGGEYLSMSEVPYKKLYLCFLYVWAACSLLWLIHILAFYQWNVALQATLLLLPLTKLAACYPAYLYWISASQDGVYPNQLGLYKDGAAVLDRTVTFVMLYICSTGWRILKPHMDAKEIKTLVGMTLALGASQALYALYSGFVIFVVLLAYLLALRVVFAAVVENGNALLRQMHLLVRHDIDHTKTPLQQKLSQYRYLQVYLVAYISVDVIFSLWSAIFLRSQPWMSDMMTLAISVLLFACLALSFGLRPFNPFYRPVFETMLLYPEELAPPAEEDEEAWERLARPERHAEDEGEGDGEGLEGYEPSGAPGRPFSGGASLNSDDLDAPLVPREGASSSGSGASRRRRRNAQQQEEHERLWYPCMRVPDPAPRIVQVRPAAAGGAGMNAASIDWSSASASPSLRGARPSDTEPLLILDCPLSATDEQAVMIGRLLPQPPSLRERRRKAQALQQQHSGSVQAGSAVVSSAREFGEEFAHLPVEAHPYLPICMRRGLRARRRAAEAQASAPQPPSQPRRQRSERSRARRHAEDYI